MTMQKVKSKLGGFLKCSRVCLNTTVRWWFFMLVSLALFSLRRGFKAKAAVGF